MSSIGMCALFCSVAVNSIPTSTIFEDSDKMIESKSDGLKEARSIARKNRSASTAPGLYSYMSNPREAIQRYIFGYHSKTKRTLAEEAECGDEISVCSWIRDGVDPNEVDAYGYTPLLNAAVLGRYNAVLQLIKNGADVNKSGPYGFTPLHAAAQNGHREVVALLLKNKADINAQNQDKDTPMHLALRSQQIEIVYMLLVNGGNAKIEGFNKKDCIQCAKECGLNDLANRLKNYHPWIGYHAYSSPVVSSIQSKTH